MSYRLPKLGIAAAALLLLVNAFTVQPAEARRGRGVGIAIGAGILGAIILNEAYKPERRRGYYGRGYYGRGYYGRSYYDDGYYYDRPRRAHRKRAVRRDYTEARERRAERVQTEPKAAKNSAEGDAPSQPVDGYKPRQ
jgi:hypothetical protein